MGSEYRNGRKHDSAACGADAATGRDPEIAVMARNGITRIPAHHYHVDGYRYSNLADALAQVKRSAAGREAAK